MPIVRQATDRILEMIESGVLNKDTVITACLKYMSEDDVADMARSNEFFVCDDCNSPVDANERQCEACYKAEFGDDEEETED